MKNILFEPNNLIGIRLILLTALFELFHFSAFEKGNIFEIVPILILFSICLSFDKTNPRTTIILGCLSIMAIFFQSWATMANHSWLVLWILTPITISLIFNQPFNISNYARFCLAIVMFFAAIQKIISGNYLDGSFLTYLGLTGSITEKAFLLSCFYTAKVNCLGIQFLSWVSVLWQLFVALLLFTGRINKSIIFVEISFFFIVALLTDEFNFFVLNIVLLNMYYRFINISIFFPWFIVLLIVDYFTINGLWLFLNDKLF